MSARRSIIDPCDCTEQIQRTEEQRLSIETNKEIAEVFDEGGEEYSEGLGTVLLS